MEYDLPTKLMQSLVLISSLITFCSSSPGLSLHHQCGDTGKPHSDSAYHANLNQLLSSLSANCNRTGFFNATAGAGMDRLYGLVLCKGDVAARECQECTDTAIKFIKRLCPERKAAIIWYENCRLRYSNDNFFSVVDESLKDHLWNEHDVSNPEEFKKVLREMMSNLSSVAAYNASSRMFATGEADLNETQKLYGLVQCTRDLFTEDCKRCLQSAVADIWKCCEGQLLQGGRILGVSCNLRYELYPFFHQSSSSASSPSNSKHVRGKRKNFSRIVILIVVRISGIVSGVAIVSMIYVRKKKQKSIVAEHVDKFEMEEVESMKHSLVSIRAATDDFSEANKVGEGGFGAVYKGRLPDGREVVVKRLSRHSKQGSEEFMNEVALIAKLQHQNPVRLLGWCLQGDESILIYEFVPNKSLDKFLFAPVEQARLDWPRRYQIIEGIARGLLYLHEDSHLRVVHRDLKSGNVLLDAVMNPKISDFGLARIFGAEQTQGNTNRIAGTYGYMAPEYAMRGFFSVKSDVYSFGVLVLEIITGRKNNILLHSGEIEDLPSNAWRHWNNRTILEMVDPAVRESCSANEVIRCIHIALLCVQDDAGERPNMSTVGLILKSHSVNLPFPLQPTFFPSGADNQGSYLSRHGPWLLSGNELSITDLIPR